MRRGSRRHDQDSELTLDRYQGGGRCFEVRYSVVCISVRRETQRSNAKISSSPENSARCPEERNTVCCGDSCASWQFRIRNSGFAAWAHSPNRRFGSARKAHGRSARPTRRPGAANRAYSCIFLRPL